MDEAETGSAGESPEIPSKTAVDEDRYPLESYAEISRGPTSADPLVVSGLGSMLQSPEALDTLKRFVYRLWRKAQQRARSAETDTCTLASNESSSSADFQLHPTDFN